MTSVDNNVYRVHLRMLQSSKEQETSARLDRADAHDESEEALAEAHGLSKKAVSTGAFAKDLEEGAAKGVGIAHGAGAVGLLPLAAMFDPINFLVSFAAGVGIAAGGGALAGKGLGYLAGTDLRARKSDLEAVEARVDLTTEQLALTREQAADERADAEESAETLQQFAAEVRQHQERMRKRIA